MFLIKKVCVFFMSFLFISCMATKPVDPRINIIGNFLVTDISITDVSSVINNSGFMEIQVVGINKTAFYKQFEYKIEWLDNNGLKISTIMSRWTTFPAYEKSEFRFKAVAPKKTATNYRILIRKGGN